MDLQQPHFSAFTRFSDMLKDNTRRKHSSHATKRNPSITTIDSAHTSASDQSFDMNSTKDGRRSSMGNYTNRVRQIFSSTPPSTSHNPSSKKTILSLPPELLQQTFTYLDLFSLLHLQSVCRTFSSLIPSSSPSLAQLLYLKPSRTLQIYACVPATFDFEIDVDVVGVADGVQGVGTRVTRGTRKEVRLSRRCRGLVGEKGEIEFHPVIRGFDGFVEREGCFAPIACDTSLSDRRSWGANASDDDAGSGNGKLEKIGSWRNMLVSMPPLREIRIRLAKTRGVVRVLRAGEDEDGLRLGELFDALEEWARE